MSRNTVADLLVCYDISDPRRLGRVHRRMCRWGTPLQYSVFYCRLTEKRRRHMENDLRDLINEHVDDVRIYGIKSSAPIRFMGKKPLADGVRLFGHVPLESLYER